MTDADELAKLATMHAAGSLTDDEFIAAKARLLGDVRRDIAPLMPTHRTRRQLEIAIIEWIDWYNHRRLHSEIGDIPPAEHETIWYRQQHLALAAGNP